MALVIGKNKMDEDLMVQYVHQRVHDKNKNFICMFVGPTGSGKTYASLRFAEKLDPEFDIDNVVFSAEGFMNLLNGNVKELKSGSVVLWDEMQVGMSNMDYQGFIAKSLNFVLTTFRHRNLILLCTSPYYEIVNNTSRKLFHAVFELKNIDNKNNKSIIKPSFLQINTRTGKTYFKYLRVATGDGVSPISSYRMGLPSPELIDAYEIKKTQFTTDLNADIMQDINEKMGKTDEQQPNKPLTPNQIQIVAHLKTGMTQSQVAEAMNVSLSAITTSVKYIRIKGYGIVKSFDKEKGTFYAVTEPITRA